jgi:hypothetical protein
MPSDIGCKFGWVAASASHLALQQPWVDRNVDMCSEPGFVQMVFQGLHLERPPKVRLFFDVRLVMREVDSLDVYRLGVDPRLIVGHWCGSDGFFALRLPAAARVALRGFPVSLWGDVPDVVTIEVECAEGLAIAGAPAEAWFDVDPLCGAGADVDAAPLADQRGVIAARQMPAPQRALVDVVAGIRTRLTFDVGTARSGANVPPLPVR